LKNFAFALEAKAAVKTVARAEAICEEQVGEVVVSYSLSAAEALIADVDLVKTVDVLVVSADATVAEVAAAGTAGTVAGGMAVVEGPLLVMRPGDYIRAGLTCMHSRFVVVEGAALVAWVRWLNLDDGFHFWSWISRSCQTVGASSALAGTCRWA